MSNSCRPSTVVAAFVVGILLATPALHASTLPVTSGLVLHLDANDPLNNGGSSLPANNSAVGTWFDTSASGFNATASGAGQPTFKLNAILNRPAFRFDGVDDYFTLGTLLGKQTTYTAIMVLVNSDDSITTSPFSSNNSSGGNASGWLTFVNLAGRPGQLYYNIGGGGALYRDGYTANDVFATNQISIIAQTYTPGDTFVRAYLDNVQQTTSPDSSTSASSIAGPAFESAIGRLGAYSGFYFPGDIAQMIVYDHVLSTADRNAVGDYLHELYVPEPASLAMLAGGALALVRRRVRVVR